MSTNVKEFTIYDHQQDYVFTVETTTAHKALTSHLERKGLHPNVLPEGSLYSVWPTGAQYARPYRYKVTPSTYKILLVN